MKAPIHSVKHYVQTSLTTVATGTVSTIILIAADAIQNVNQVFEVQEGSVIKAVYVELWIIGASGNSTHITTLAKMPSGVDGFDASEMAALGSASNKKNILFVGQGLTSNDGIAGPVPIMRGWYKIPKSKQRFGLGDTLELQVFSQAGANDICGFATYKEYT